MTRSAAATAILDHLGSAFARGGPFVLGICGAQGSGKSTSAAAIAAALEARGATTALLSLDDLYLPREDRERLAREVHPLFRTRGVPGTHDVERGLSVLDALAAGRPCRLPRFDKASDTPCAQADWPEVRGRIDVLLFEGWCVGARPQPEAALATPVNALERDEDRDGRWRRAVNEALGGPYRALFARLDRLVLLAAPGFEIVAAWRGQQERTLRRKLAEQGRDPGRTMDDAALARFLRHYERLTRHILAEMPARADLTLRLDAERRVAGSTSR